MTDSSGIRKILEKLLTDTQAIAAFPEFQDEAEAALEQEITKRLTAFADALESEVIGADEEYTGLDRQITQNFLRKKQRQALKDLRKEFKL